MASTELDWTLRIERGGTPHAWKRPALSRVDYCICFLVISLIHLYSLNHSCQVGEKLICELCFRFFILQPLDKVFTVSVSASVSLFTYLNPKEERALPQLRQRASVGLGPEQGLYDLIREHILCFSGFQVYYSLLSRPVKISVWFASKHIILGQLQSLNCSPGLWSKLNQRLQHEDQNYSCLVTTVCECMREGPQFIQHKY